MELFKSSDNEVVREVIERFRIARKTSSAKLGEMYEQLVKPKIVILVDWLKKTDTYLADRPSILNNLVETIEKAFHSSKELVGLEEDSKKKQ